MKKIIIGLMGLSLFTVFAGVVLASPSDILYFLNWGEYIDMSLVQRFEQEKNCQVILETVTSSEAMYQKITSGTTPYDVAIPGDYTVQTLYKEGRLKELDVTNPDYPHLSAYQTMFVNPLHSLTSKYMVDSKKEGYASYYMPYFYGAYSIFYSDHNPEVGQIIQKNGISSLYNPALYSSKPKIGMYDTARWVVASALMADHLNPNITDLSGNTDGNDLSGELQDQLVNQIKNAGFYEFGNDQLKRDCANGSIDACFSQLGDFFDALYLLLEEGSEVHFNVFVPDFTAAFFDSMVIPSTSRNSKLANAFIDFMMDPDNAYQNARAIGYSPTLKEVCSRFEKEADDGEYYYGDETTKTSLTLRDFLDRYPVYLDPLGHSDQVYVLEPKSNQYLTSCESIFNRALA